MAASAAAGAGRRRSRSGTAGAAGRRGNEVAVLQELTADSGAAAWAIGSLLFFIAVYTFVAARIVRANPDDLAARARMALDDDEKA